LVFFCPDGSQAEVLLGALHNTHPARTPFSVIGLLICFSIAAKGFLVPSLWLPHLIPVRRVVLQRVSALVGAPFWLPPTARTRSLIFFCQSSLDNSRPQAPACFTPACHCVSVPARCVRRRLHSFGQVSRVVVALSAL
jgi:hypothetical protein